MNLLSVQDIQDFIAQRKMDERSHPPGASYSCDHERYSTWGQITPDEEQRLECLGRYRDPNMKSLTYKYIYLSGSNVLFLNSYPYHFAEYYRCPECRRLFYIYLENGGHAPFRKCLPLWDGVEINGDVGNIEICISRNEKERLADDLGLTKMQFDQSVAATEDEKLGIPWDPLTQVVVSLQKGWHPTRAGLEVFSVAAPNALIYEIQAKYPWPKEF